MTSAFVKPVCGYSTLSRLLSSSSCSPTLTCCTVRRIRHLRGGLGALLGLLGLLALRLLGRALGGPAARLGGGQAPLQRRHQVDGLHARLGGGLDDDLAALRLLLDGGQHALAVPVLA